MFVLDSALRALFHVIARSKLLKTLASRVGMRGPTSFARRFVAGETNAEAIEVARALESRGMMITLDHLGEGVTTLNAAEAATRDYLSVIDAIVAADVGRNISLKLTQLGLDVDRAIAVDNLRRILERAEPAGIFVRIDMESSAYTDITLEIFETLWHQGSRNIGVVLQAALHRTEADARRISALGARIRLVKGAYNEPRSIAYRRKRDVDAAYARLMQLLLTGAHYPALATHDPAMIDLARRWAAERQIPLDRFEFQMLHGIRRDLQTLLVKAGYRVRIYVPFGREWFPYFMRRLAERPANVLFVIRSLAGESG
jgi:proline dehydrogenase